MSNFETYLEKKQANASPEENELFAKFDKRFFIARQVLLLRRDAEMTQVQLAEKVGMDQAEISKIERGAANPTTETLQRIANAFPGVTFGMVRDGHLIEA